MSGNDVVPATNASDAALIAQLGPIFAAILAAGGGGGSANANTTDTSTTVTKLTMNSAKALMDAAKATVGYTQGFSGEEVKQFMDDFNAAQAKQIEKIITIAKQRTVAGGGKTPIDTILNTVAREEFPSFFKPVDFATDYIWNKVNFTDSATLSGKNLGILQQVRASVADFQILGFSDSEALLAAKDIAKGKYTLADLNVKLQQIAIKEYPQFKDRFAQDPTLTTKGIADPIITMLADTWEIPKDTISNKDPILMQWMHPGGVDGKQPAMSYYEAYQKALNDPRREKTKAANEGARDSATAFASAMGFGI